MCVQCMVTEHPLQQRVQAKGVSVTALPAKLPQKASNSERMSPEPQQKTTDERN